MALETIQVSLHELGFSWLFLKFRPSLRGRQKGEQL